MEGGNEGVDEKVQDESLDPRLAPQPSNGIPSFRHAPVTNGSTQLRQLEQEVISKNRARPFRSTATPGVVPSSTPRSAVAELNRLEQDVLSKSQSRPFGAVVPGAHVSIGRGAKGFQGSPHKSTGLSQLEADVVAKRTGTILATAGGQQQGNDAGRLAARSVVQSSTLGTIPTTAGPWHEKQPAQPHSENEFNGPITSDQRVSFVLDDDSATERRATAAIVDLTVRKLARGADTVRSGVPIADHAAWDANRADVQDTSITANIHRMEASVVSQEDQTLPYREPCAAQSLAAEDNHDVLEVYETQGFHGAPAQPVYGQSHQGIDQSQQAHEQGMDGPVHAPPDEFIDDAYGQAISPHALFVEEPAVGVVPQQASGPPVPEIYQGVACNQHDRAADGDGIEAFLAEEVVDATGVAVVMSEEEERMALKKNRRYIAIRGICLVVIVAFIVGLVLAFAGGTRQAESIGPTSMPSVSPTSAPSFSPTTDRFNAIVDIASGISRPGAFQDRNSPQYLAAMFVSHDDNLRLPVDSPRLVQRYLLAVFYFALDGDNWDERGRNDPLCQRNHDVTCWLINDECTWLAISCNDDGVVTTIFFVRLRGNNLQGELPFEVSQFSTLKSLSLLNNKLQGTIPDFLGTLTKLTSLILQENMYTGTIPVNLLSGATLLETILFGDNALTGSIPSIIGLLPLTQLRLERNQFSGEIPTAVGDIDGLVVLEMQENGFNGTLPENLFSNPTLLGLRLNDNSLSGMIPQKIGEMVQLADLQLNANLLTGSLPEGMFKLPRLSTLNLGFCRLSGTLSEDFSKLNTTLHDLILNNNEFKGSIPTAFDELTKLNQLLLHANPLTGTISRVLCDERGDVFSEIKNLTAPTTVTCTCCDLEL